jgi:hypothetical protein
MNYGVDLQKATTETILLDLTRNKKLNEKFTIKLNTVAKKTTDKHIFHWFSYTI